MTKKYGSPEKGKRVCGALQKRLEGAVQGLVNEPTRDELGARTLAAATEEQIFDLIDKKKIITLQDKGRLYIKLFLVDGSVNYNDWGVDKNSIPENITSAIGKPVVVYKNSGKERVPRRTGEFDHPELDDKDYNHALAYQDLFRVATFIDVVQATDGSWWGIAEVTDDGTKRALVEDPHLPLFTSPTIRLLQPVHTAEENRAIQHWEFMHTAVVDRPAYGVKKAYMAGQCSGEKDSCLLQLRKAAILENGYGCGFCTYAALMELGVTEEDPYEIPIEDAAGALVEVEDDGLEPEELFDAAALGPHAASRPNSQFAYVPKGKPKSARKFPIYDAAHVRNALARFSQANLPSGAKGAVLAKICRAARKFGIDSETCSSRKGSELIDTERDTSHVASKHKNESADNIMSAKENKADDKGRGDNGGNTGGTSGETSKEDKEQKMREELRKKEVAQDEKTRGKDTTDAEFEEFKTRRELERKQIDRDEGRSASELLEKIEKLTIENASLQKRLEKASSDNEALTSLNAQFNERLSTLEKEREDARKERRFNDISQVINGSLAYRDSSKEVRDKQVEMFFKSSMTVDQVREFIQPLEANIKKASIDARSASSGVVYNSKVRSASTNDSHEKPMWLQYSERLLNNGGVEY